MFRKMEYVYCVYKEGNFTRAAEKLFVSQPCLSAAIKKIEHELGMPLFERRYSDLRPTRIGYEYLKAVEKIMGIQQEFEKKMIDIKNVAYGTISVGGSNYVSSYVLPYIVSEFSKQYPKIEILLTETSSIELEKKIGREEIDLVIDSYDEEQAFHDCYPLADEKILLAVPANSKSNQGLENYRMTPCEIHDSKVHLATIPEISIDCFKEEKFILLKSGNSMYRHAMEVFKKSNFKPDVRFQLDQLGTSYSLTASGNGACFVTDVMFKYHRFKDDVFLYNIKDGGTRTLYAITKKNEYTSNAISEFIKTAKKAIEEKIL